MKTSGRIICDELKRVRLELAKANGINYQPTVCNHQGECAGTCPACEAELAELTRQIKEKKNAKVVGIVPLKTAAIAAGLSIAMASCENKTKVTHYDDLPGEIYIDVSDCEVPPPPPEYYDIDPVKKYYDIDPEDIPPTRQDGSHVTLLNFSNDPVASDSVASWDGKTPLPEVPIPDSGENEDK